MLEFTEVGMQEAYGMALMISLVQQLKGWIERIDGDALWDYLSFIVMLEGGAMHGVKWMSVENDRMVEMFSLHSIYSYVLSS